MKITAQFIFLKRALEPGQENAGSIFIPSVFLEEVYLGVGGVGGGGEQGGTQRHPDQEFGLPWRRIVAVKSLFCRKIKTHPADWETAKRQRCGTGDLSENFNSFVSDDLYPASAGFLTFTTGGSGLSSFHKSMSLHSVSQYRSMGHPMPSCEPLPFMKPRFPSLQSLRSVLTTGSQLPVT